MERPDAFGAVCAAEGRGCSIRAGNRQAFLPSDGSMADAERGATGTRCGSGPTFTGSVRPHEFLTTARYTKDGS